MPSGRALSDFDFWDKEKQRAAFNRIYAVTLHVAKTSISDKKAKSQVPFEKSYGNQF